MTEYMELMQDDDVMQDVRKRRAEASKIYLSFRGNMEGFNRYVDEQTKAFGYRSEPTGHGTYRLVKIEQPAGDPV
jgi:hypothetical protein